MTLVLLAASSILAAAGTRLAAAGFVAAAAVGAATGGTMAAAAAWTSALAAGLIGFGVAPRRLAVPALGATAAILAGSASNAATVLAAWIVATGVAVAGRGEGREGRRWALGLLLSDVLVGGAVAYTVASGGFARWTVGIDGFGAGLLVAAALVRLPLAAGVAGARDAALLVVRAQVVVLASIGLAAAAREVLLAGAIAGAGAFAVAGTSPDDAFRDGTQEAGLVVLALAAGGLGWEPGGWLWGVLAGGTLIHYLRLSVEAGDGLNAQVKAVLTGGGIALPFLPAVAALSAAAAGQRDLAAVVVIAALASGLGARAWFGSEPRRARRRRAAGDTWWRRARPAAALSLAVAAALWAPLLTLPRPPGAGPLPWPPVWAGLAALGAGAGGLFVPSLAPAREPRRRVRAVRSGAPVDVDVPPAALAALMSALALGAAALWVVGWLRGFL